MSTVGEETYGGCSECGIEITKVEARYYDGLCRSCFYTRRFRE